MTKGKPRPEFPDRKISETFLHFAEPLLEPLGPHATEEQENQALQIAFTVWNAVVYESAIRRQAFHDNAPEFDGLSAGSSCSCHLYDLPKTGPFR